MKILLKHVHIKDANSPHNDSVKNILIEDGIIKKISAGPDEADEIYELDNVFLSPGWVDVFADFADPGFEYRETLESGANAAAAGGFTQVFILPNTNPSVQNKSQAEYIIQRSKSLLINILPLGAVTKNTEGKELAEMYDMKAGGSVAFSDGSKPLQSAGLMIKALQYIRSFNGTLIQLPADKSIAQHGLMNEGIISTQLGLPGIPSVAEELIIRRDIELLRYAQSKLHITGVSTEKSLELIIDAKNEGLNITCSVAPYHLFFCDEDLTDYDTNLKVNPPLRTRKDMMALREAVKNDLIDCIASHHSPQNADAKICEFEYAKNGMTGLQTAYSALQTVLPELSGNAAAAMFSTNARKIFGLNDATIREGNNAELTLFNSKENFVLTKENNQSKSLNSPFFDKELKGKVVGIFNKCTLTLNK